jgi:hypothetical protein
MQTRSLLIAISLILLNAGCSGICVVDIVGNGGDVHLQGARTENSAIGPDLMAIPDDVWEGAEPILDGTVICLEARHSLELEPGYEGPELGPECYATSVDGPVTLSEIDGASCYEFAEGGTLWTFEALDCAQSDAELEDDSLELRTVGPEAVQPRFFPWPEAGAAAWGWPTVPEEAPSDALLAFGEEVLIAAGQPVRLGVGMFEGATGGWAVWNPADTSLELVPISGSAEVVPAGEGASGAFFGEGNETDPRSLRVRLGDGARAEVLMTLGDDSWSVAQLRGVPASRATSLDLSVAVSGEVYDYFRNDGPFAARAWARTSSGEIIHGAPIKWSVGEQAMSLRSATEEIEVYAGADYLAIADHCDPPTESVGPRHAVLRARLGVLSRSVELDWTYFEADEEDDAEWERSEKCVEPTSGCGDCAVAGDTGPAPAWLGCLLLLAGVRRRAR